MSVESSDGPFALLIRIPEYLLVVLLGTTVMVLGTVVMALPSIAPAIYLSDGAMVPYLIGLSITGFVIAAVQLIAKGDWIPDDFNPDEHPLSKGQMVAISTAWYNVLVLAGLGFGLAAVSLGYGAAAPFIALFIGPIDVMLVKRVGVSPLTLLVAAVAIVVQLLYELWNDGEDTPVVFTSSELLYVATGQRFRDRTKGEFLGRSHERRLF